MKKQLKIILPLLLVLALAGIVNAACTVTIPGASAVASGLYSMNVTATLNDIRNCSLSATSALTGGSATATLINSTGNSTGIPNILNATLDTTGEEDASDWVFSFTCYNSTGTSETCSRSGVTINNTVPSIGSCTQEGKTAANATVLSASSFAFVCTAWNATGCNVYWKDSTANAFASSSQSGSDYQLNAVTFSSSYADAGTTLTANLKGAGDNVQTLYFDCTDGSDTITTVTYGLKAEGSSDDGGSTGDNDKVIITIQNILKNKKLVLLLFSAAIAIIVLIYVVLFMHKK